MGVAVLTTYCHNQVICPAVGVQIFEHSASNETSLEFSAHKKQSVGLFPPWSVCFLSAVSCVLRELTDWSGCVGPQSAGYAGPARGSLSRMPVLYWSQHGGFHNFLSETLLVFNSGNVTQ